MVLLREAGFVPGKELPQRGGQEGCDREQMDGRGMVSPLDHPFGLNPPSILGASPSLERVYLDSFTNVDIEVAEHQETDWATGFFVFLP